VIRLSARIRHVEPGGTLVLLADDPAAEEDVRLWSRSHGHEIVEIVRGDFLRIRVRRRAA
jgi:TusA-related sulfurtransferase